MKPKLKQQIPLFITTTTTTTTVNQQQTYYWSVKTLYVNKLVCFIVELTSCQDFEMEQFPIRMSDWLFKVMEELVRISLLPLMAGERCCYVEFVFS